MQVNTTCEADFFTWLGGWVPQIESIVCIPEGEERRGEKRERGEEREKERRGEKRRGDKRR